MESTDRPQVRDIYEMLKPFDLRAMVAGYEFEIAGFIKGDDCLVYIDVEKDSDITDLEDRIESLESECGTLEEDNQELKNKLDRILEMAETNPEKLARFILEGGE